MDYAEIEKLAQKVKQENIFISDIKNEIAKNIVGQECLEERIILSFIM